MVLLDESLSNNHFINLEVSHWSLTFEEMIIILITPWYIFDDLDFNPKRNIS